MVIFEYFVFIAHVELRDMVKIIVECLLSTLICCRGTAIEVIRSILGG